jgi:uncharacterized protein YcfL
MTWAGRRKLLYSSIVVAVILFFGYLLIAPYFNVAPTCTDGKQNGNETGIDCGGSCPLACLTQVDQLSVLWARAFEVVPGRYNAVAYLENHNPATAVNKMTYRFRFADKDNIYLGKRDGETFIPPGGRFAIFEPAVDLGNSIPVHTSLEFTSPPVWVQVSPKLINQLKISVSSIQLENEDTSPKLFATVKNNSLFRIPEVSFVAILYDATGNAINVSHTYLNVLLKEQSAKITFTWPEPMSAKVVAKEIIPMFNIFSAKLK